MIDTINHNTKKNVMLNMKNNVQSCPGKMVLNFVNGTVVLPFFPHPFHLLKSMGIPTPRNPHYQVLVIPICLSPHVFQITDYLADLDFCSNKLHTTTTIE
jgi:hypothetical protein